MQSIPLLIAEQLFFKLKRITKEHGSLVYPLNLCEEMLPMIHKINHLKKNRTRWFSRIITRARKSFTVLFHFKPLDN